MAYRLLDIRSGLTCCDEGVTISIYENLRSGEKLWCVDEERYNRWVFDEKTTPEIVRMLYRVMVARGSRVEKTKADTWILIAPHLSRERQHTHMNAIFYEDPFMKPAQKPRMDAFEPFDDTYYYDKLILPWNRVHLTA